MATEALVTDQTAEEHVEEVKLTNVERKDEQIKVDDSEGVEVSAIESEAAIESEEKQEDEKSKPVMEEVKKEATENADAEASANEAEAAIVSEEKQEDKKSESVTEEVTKEEAEDEKASDPLAGDSIEKEETLKQEADSTDFKDEADSSAAVKPAVEAEEKELKNQVEITDTSEPSKPSIEASAEESEATSVQQLESETAKEPAVPEAAAAAAQQLIATAPEEEAEEVTTEELSQVSSVSVTESKEAEALIVSPVTEPAPYDITTSGFSDALETFQVETLSPKQEENTESPKEEPLATDSYKEVSDDVPEAVLSETADAVAAEVASVKELKEEGEETAVTEEIPIVPKVTESDNNAFASAEESIASDTNPVTESVESVAKPDVKNEEGMQERTVVAEEPTMSEATKTDAATQVTGILSEGSGGVEKVEEKKEVSMEGSVEFSKDPDPATEVPQVSSEGEKASEGIEDKKDGSLEGEKTTLGETSRRFDVEQGKSNVNTEADSLDSLKTEKDDEKTPDDSANDTDEAPKAGVPSKSSQRQSNNIFSKVKQSIVKVKKAIIGKSPSSKTMSAEGKDEIKVK